MKRTISYILLLAMLFTLFACNNVAPTGTDTPNQNTTPEKFLNSVSLNIMSFNVYSGNSDSVEASNGDPVDMRIKRRAPKLNDILLGENIHIAGLQEVNTAWQSWLANDLDENYGYVGEKTAKTGEGGYIVYRKDMLNVETSGVFWLAEGAPSSAEIGWDGKYDRLCYWAVFKINQTGQYLLFMNTHLDHQGALARAYGAKMILDQMQSLLSKIEHSYGINDCPVIVTGDMNAVPGSAAYRSFTKTLSDSFLIAQENAIPEDASTSPGLYHRTSGESYASSNHRIDYIFVSNGNTFVEKYNMIHTCTNLGLYGDFLSDHNAVTVRMLVSN